MDMISLCGLLLAAALAIMALRRIRTHPGRSLTRILIILLLIGAAALIAFAAWGQYTPAGQHAYDEMDGIYPFAAVVLGVLLAIAASLTAWVAGRRSRSSS